MPIEVSQDDLLGATLTGGAGTDTLQLAGGGTFDLTLPHVFTSIEAVAGSSEHDTIIVDQARFAGILSFDGGALSGAKWDEIVLRGARFDFTDRTLAGIDRLSLKTDGAVFIAPTKTVALLASGHDSQNDRLEATGVVFDENEIAALHRQGIDTVVDAAGTHVNAAPAFQHLHGDRLKARAGETLHVDAGRDGLVSDADEAYTLMTVAAPRGIDAPGRLRIGATDGVTLSGGYAAGSLVKVDGVEIGMLWEAGDASLTVAFNGVNANSARVTELLRAVTFTTADTAPRIKAEQVVTITLADEGGRRATASVTIEQEAVLEKPEILLSGAQVREQVPEGTFVGLLTARATGLGDAFAFTLLDDAGGRFQLESSKLLVRAGARLDYETGRTHEIKVRATGLDGLVLDRTFTITVEDVAEEAIVSPPATNDKGVIGGTERNDTLQGGRGRDKLSGEGGDDRLFGRQGDDRLSGGEGRDTFVFDTKPHRRTNVDRIADFDPRQDSIYLENGIFKALGRKGSWDKPAKLAKKAFWKGTKAHDANDRVIYNKKTGALLYDADGTGSTAAVTIAVLEKKPKAVSHMDIWVI